MTARRVTAVLAGMFIALCAWMYLRDLGAATPVASERAQAQSAAGMMLRLLTAPGSCAVGCAADVVDRQGAELWRVQLRTRAWRRCFLVQLGQFAFSSAHGMSGLRSANCP
jgi:hypothetical protein